MEKSRRQKRKSKACRRVNNANAERAKESNGLEIPSGAESLVPALGRRLCPGFVIRHSACSWLSPGCLRAPVSSHGWSVQSDAHGGEPHLLLAGAGLCVSSVLRGPRRKCFRKEVRASPRCCLLERCCLSPRSSRATTQAPAHECRTAQARAQVPRGPGPPCTLIGLPLHAGRAAGRAGALTYLPGVSEIVSSSSQGARLTGTPRLTASCGFPSLLHDPPDLARFPSCRGYHPVLRGASPSDGRCIVCF